MPFLDWTRDLEVGVPRFDDDHRRLIGMLNELYDAMRSGHGEDVLTKTLDGLIAYTRTHFRGEEAFLQAAKYPGLAGHQREHEALTQQVLDVQKRARSAARSTLTIEVLHFLRSWLVNHIQGSDKRYAEFVKDRPSR